MLVHRNLRRAGISLLGTLAVLFLFPGTTFAQDEAATSFQVEHFEPLPSQGKNILNTGTSDVLGHLQPSAGVLMHFVKAPLVFVTDDDQTTRLIDTQLKVEAMGSIGLFDVAELGFALPLVVAQSGDPLDVLGRSESISGFALADMRVVPKVRLPVDRDELGGFGLSLLAPIYLPIGDTGSFNSDGNVRVEPRLVADWAHKSGFKVAGNLGYQVRQEATARNVVTNDNMRYSLALEAPVGVKDLTVIASLFGTTPIQAEPNGDLENRANPRELLAGLQYKLPYDLVASAGAGTGLSAGVGSPSVRAFASIGYTPMGAAARNRDEDGDGILDADDKCVGTAEDVDGYQDEDGCPDPDNDNDSILDGADKCPIEAEDFDGFEDEDGCADLDNDGDGLPDTQDECPMKPGGEASKGCPTMDEDGDGILDAEDVCPKIAEDMDGFEDKDGCPEPDNDQDKILDADDRCPNDPEDVDKFEDEDGCPDPDNDNDGVADAVDKCPNDAEVYNGKDDEDGCPDEGAKLITLEDKRIRILEKVFFDMGKATISKKSYKILDVVSTVLVNNKSITKIRIEGHTDDVGEDDSNLKLSTERAESVKNYLVSKGVDASRLEVKGFGETAPLCADLEELRKNRRKNRKKIKNCRRDNRRIEFNVLEQNGKPVQP